MCYDCLFKIYCTQCRIQLFVELIMNVANRQAALANTDSPDYYNFEGQFSFHQIIIFQLWAFNINIMEHQKSSIFNPILSTTSRQFYTRRVPHRQPSNAQLDKVLKTLNCSQEKRIHRKIKTENRDDFFDKQCQLENMKKIAKVKLDNLIKRQSREWKELLEAFQNYSRSSSRQSLLANELNFFIKMSEIVAKRPLRMIEPTDKPKQHNLASRKDNLQAVRLSKENELLKQKLSCFEDTMKYSSQKASHNEIRISSIDAIEEDLQAKKLSTKMMYQVQNELQLLRDTNDMLREQKKNLQDKIAELKCSNQNLCQQIVKIRYFSSQNNDKMQSWRNIMLMQNEQITSLKRDKLQLKKQLADLNKKYHVILKRMNTLSNKDQARITQITKKNVEVFSQQIESFQRVRNAFVFKGAYQALATQKEAGSNYYKKYLGDKECVSNSEGIKRLAKDYYRYYRPSFYVFLEKYFEYQGVDHQNFDQIGLPVGMTFIVTLRSILDAKYNEYLLSRRVNRQLSSLSNFTISWLSNFMIEKKTKQQEQITTDVCFETIGSFYIQLMSPDLNSNWEVITFREFLLQSLTIDDLVFYLKCRFTLLKGDGMAGKGAFMEIFQVNYVDALYLIQQIVSDFDYRKRLQEYLKRVAQYQRRKHLIDAHFVLRLLLEYYQHKKTQNFTQISKTFSSYLKQRNSSMPFETFLKIFDYNSFELSLIEIVEIFQKAFCLGRGSVYLQNIFTVMNEEGYLCRQVQRLFQKHQIFEQSQISLQSSTSKHVQSIKESFKTILQKPLLTEITCIGLQSTKTKINDFLQQKTTTAESTFEKIELIFELSLFNLKKMFYSANNRKSSQEDFVNFLPCCLSMLKQIVKKSIERKHSMQMLERFVKKQAAKQILHFYRRKRLLVRSYFSSVDQKEKVNERSQQIRKEFNNLIDSLKQKYSHTHKLTSEKELSADYDC